MPKRKERFDALDAEEQRLVAAEQDPQKQQKIKDDYAKLKKESGVVIEKEILDKIEVDLVRAKETGNVSYDIKTSLNDVGYAPAIEEVLKEIQSPQIIPVEIKEGVGAVSAKIREEEQKQLFQKSEEEAKRIIAKREEFAKQAAEEEKKIKSFKKNFKTETDKLQYTTTFNFNQYVEKGTELIKKGEDEGSVIELLIVQSAQDLLEKMRDLVTRAAAVDDLSLRNEISDYADANVATDQNYADIITKYDDFNKLVNAKEKEITKQREQSAARIEKMKKAKEDMNARYINT